MVDLDDDWPEMDFYPYGPRLPNDQCVLDEK